MSHKPPDAAGGFPTDDVMITVGLAGALGTWIFTRLTGQAVPVKLESLLFVGGVFGLGISVFSLGAGLRCLPGLNKVVLGLMLAVSVACISVADFAMIAGRGLELSTPFVVAIVMGILGLRRS